MSKPWIGWLDAAADDLQLVEKILGEQNLTHLVAFHSQQAVEKTLKALMEYRRLDFQKIHSLNKLFKQCESYIKIDDNDLVNTLDALYVESRYPVELGYLPYGKPSVEDSRIFYQFAMDIHIKVKAIVGSGAK